MERHELDSSDKIIYSVEHNTYIVINTQLATCFGSSEPYSGQYLIYGHGVFSECAHYWIPYCLQTIFILKFKLKIYWPIYISNLCKTSISTLVNPY